MYKFMSFVCAVVLVCALSDAGSAKAATISAKEPDKVAEIAKGYGSSSLEKDNTGDPKIRGRMEGIGYSIYFYGCKNNENCDSIQFSAGWDFPKENKLPLTAINEWNRTKRFGKAYLDREDNPRIEMSVPLAEVPVDHLEKYFSWWGIALKGFKEHITK